MALLIFEKTIGPAHVFELHGALDGDTAEKLAPRVSQVLDDGQQFLLFDLKKLTFVSSAGLSIFLAAYRRLKDTGHLRFAGLQEAVRRIFDVTALTPRLELCDSVEDALVGPGASR